MYIDNVYRRNIRILCIKVTATWTQVSTSRKREFTNSKQQGFYRIRDHQRTSEIGTTTVVIRWDSEKGSEIHKRNPVTPRCRKSKKPVTPRESRLPSGPQRIYYLS